MIPTGTKPHGTTIATLSDARRCRSVHPHYRPAEDKHRTARQRYGDVAPPGPRQPDDTAPGLSPAGISTEPMAHEYQRHPGMHSTCIGWQHESSAYWCADQIRQRAPLGAAATTVRHRITAPTRRTKTPNLRPRAASRAIELYPAQPPSLNPLPRQQRRNTAKHLAQSLRH